MKFPPLDFWTDIPERDHKRYKVSRLDLYTRGKISGVPVDDDIMYTLLGLLILEEHGPDFTTKDVGEAWLKYLPLACSAERVALANLKAGIPASKTGEKDNPYCQWIGADIRSDPWGYAAPGWPEMAAELAYRDSYLSHRRNGLYGAMFFSAAISAAFAVDTAEEALRIGLTEIPKDCLLAQAVRWALKTAPGIKNYRQAREAVDKKFDDMANVHTINNACLTVFGLILGGKDFTKVIGETVAMGRDNDCTGATAGSICGALIGAKNIPKHWTTSFGDTIHSYLIGRKKFGMNSVIKRFHKQAMRMHQ
jgi:ADP-ribosylglycohydrolase